MKRTLSALLMFAMAVFSASPTSAGLLQISLVPSAEKIQPLTNVFVDINVSGLQSGGVDNLLGAWSMDVLYDKDLLVPLLVPPATFGGGLGDVMAGEAISALNTDTPGTISLSLVSLLASFQLDALQRDAAGDLLDSFTLATLGFFAFGEAGSAFIGTTNIVLGDAFGNPLADVNGLPIPIQHLPVSIQVSEPEILALLSVALIGMMVFIQKRRR